MSTTVHADHVKKVTIYRARGIEGTPDYDLIVLETDQTGISCEMRLFLPPGGADDFVSAVFRQGSYETLEYDAEPPLIRHPVEIDDSNTIPPPWGDELVQDGAVFGDTEGCGVISSGASGYWLVDRTEGSLGGDPLGSPIQLGGTQKTAAAFLRSAGFEPWAEVE